MFAKAASFPLEFSNAVRKEYYTHPTHGDISLREWRQILTYLLTYGAEPFLRSCHLVNFRNEIIFYGEELLAPRPTPKLEDHPL
jgi:hypothetical protein